MKIALRVVLVVWKKMWPSSQLVKYWRNKIRESWWNMVADYDRFWGITLRKITESAKMQAVAFRRNVAISIPSIREVSRPKKTLEDPIGN